RLVVTFRFVVTLRLVITVVVVPTIFLVIAIRFALIFARVFALGRLALVLLSLRELFEILHLVLVELAVLHRLLEIGVGGAVDAVARTAAMWLRAVRTASTAKRRGAIVVVDDDLCRHRCSLVWRAALRPTCLPRPSPSPFERC